MARWGGLAWSPNACPGPGSVCCGLAHEPSQCEHVSACLSCVCGYTCALPPIARASKSESCLGHVTGGSSRPHPHGNGLSSLYLGLLVCGMGIMKHLPHWAGVRLIL